MKLNEKIMEFIFFIATLVSLINVIVICIFLFYSGIAFIGKIGFSDFIFGYEWQPLNYIFGIFPMILGSVYITIGAILVGVPISIACALYLLFFCNKKIYKILKSSIDIMAAIPSIVYGFFGLVVLVPIIRNLTGSSGKGILTASILLGIMIMPTIISITETSLAQVRQEYYQGALALGVSHELAILQIVLPSAKSGILAGIILGIGRAIGEAMAVVLVAGNQAIMPKSIVSGVRTLTTNVVLEMGYAQDIHREALIATSAVLFVFILLINTLFLIMKYRKSS